LSGGGAIKGEYRRKYYVLTNPAQQSHSSQIIFLATKMSQRQQAGFEEPVVLSDEDSIEELEREDDVGKAVQPIQKNVGRNRQILSDDFYRTMEANRKSSGLVNTASELTPNPLPQSNLEETLRLRLDVNLDLEVRLRAHLHGDLTLALL
jgi:hypothetical protein